MNLENSTAVQADPVVGAGPAETYERFFVPSLFRPWAGELLRRVDPRPGARVLDVACGTGVVAREVAPLVGVTGSVVGLDASPGMLAVARAVLPEGVAIDYHEGKADALPFPDAAFDLVLCQQGLQFFPDSAAAVREMGRVLAPGGRVGISVWRAREHQSLWAAFDEVAVRHFGPGGGDVLYSLSDAEELRELLEGAGFAGVTTERVVRTVRFPSSEQFVRLTVLGSAAVLPDFEQMDEAARDGLVEVIRQEFAETLAGYLEGAAVVFPLEAHIATARM